MCMYVCSAAPNQVEGTRIRLFTLYSTVEILSSRLVFDGACNVTLPALGDGSQALMARESRWLNSSALKRFHTVGLRIEEQWA